MRDIKQSLTELIGHTPLLELNRLAAAKGAKARVVAKLECFNPGGSVKDRVALAMIEDGPVQPSSSRPAATRASAWPGSPASRATKPSSPCRKR